MRTIDCPHKDATETRRICCHLFQDTQNYLDSGWQFTGKSREYNIICSNCAKDLNHVEENLLTVCTECFDDSHFYFVIGQPEIAKRSTALRFVHEDFDFVPLTAEILNIQPLEISEGCSWLALTKARQLIQIDLPQAKVTILVDLNELTPDLELSDDVTLRISPDKRFIAIANHKGVDGLVLDLATNQITMRLKRDDYYPEHCPFPVAFFAKGQQQLLVHATGWNRLDISDPLTGKLLTSREPISFRSGEPRPEHYLDYFHCELVVSPDNRRIAEDGWIWHPIGEVITWNLEQWAQGNLWESEDGPTRRVLCYRDYFWNSSLCWLDAITLAVWGYGEDDLSMIPAARIFDVRSGMELRWFPGPVGTFVFDEWLFSFSGKDGMSIWDTATGEQLFADSSFSPISYHPTARKFLTILPDHTFRLSTLTT